MDDWGYSVQLGTSNGSSPAPGSCAIEQENLLGKPALPNDAHSFTNILNLNNLTSSVVGPWSGGAGISKAEKEK